MNYMASRTLTVRIDPEMKAELDAIAAARDRDRSYLVKEALREYLEVQKWHMEHLQQGLREADAGNFVSEAKMKRTIARLTRRS
jgi:RHH-type transcriptional regulator, rel operon repressor / antitoxin RelB